MARLIGDNGLLQITAANSAVVNVATVRSATINWNTPLVEATVWSDTNTVQVPGKPSFDMSGEFVGDSASLGSTITLMRQSAAANSTIYPDKTNLANTKFSGSMYWSGSLQVSQGQVIVGQFQAAAAGSITFTES